MTFIFDNDIIDGLRPRPSLNFHGGDIYIYSHKNKMWFHQVIIKKNGAVGGNTFTMDLQMTN